MNKNLLTAAFVLFLFVIACVVGKMQQEMYKPAPKESVFPGAAGRVYDEPPAKEAAPRKPTELPTRPAPKRSAVPVTTDTVAEALAAAEEHDRPVFVHFGAAWCSPCNLMKESTLVDPELENRLTTDYVLAKIDVDQNRPDVQKYNVAAIPAYLIVDKHGNILRRGQGFRSNTELLKWLDGEAAARNSKTCGNIKI